MIKVLLIPSSDYLEHSFPQRHNYSFEHIHDREEFEVHVIRFNIFGKGFCWILGTWTAKSHGVTIRDLCAKYS